VLKGHQFHVPGARPEVVDWPTPLAWRKDLDAWLMQKAKAAGAEVRERARVTRVEPRGPTILLTINGPEEDETLSARWVIGADGANSAVRKSLVPEMKTAYVTPIRECYAGSLTLDKDYIHWFFPRGRPRPRFNVNHKDDFFLIEGSGIRELREDINRILAEYGLDPSQPPVWRDACLIPKIHRQLMDGSFHPALGNVLLVGDAAGLIFPITFEGIGSALKSGILAAEAIAQASRSGSLAAGIYLDLLQPILSVITALLSCQEALSGSASPVPIEPGGIARRLTKAYEKTLQIG
jgi:flavin-dependent dehydrogenase